MIARWVALLTLVLLLVPGAASVSVAQEGGAAPAAIAVVLRIASEPLVGLDGEPNGSARRNLGRLAEALEAWREPDASFPFTLAVSPVLCDELDLVDVAEARRVTNLLRNIARRSEALTVPYADVRLPYLRSQGAIRDELTRGARVLRECLDRTPIDALLPPGLALDGPTVEAARDRRIGLSISDLAGTAVRSRATEAHRAITLIPPVDHETFSSARTDGALVVDADVPSWPSAIATVVASGEVDAVPITQLARAVPEVFVEFTDRPKPADGRRRSIDRARRALESFEDYTLAGNAVARRYQIAYARALARTSDEWWHEDLMNPDADGRTRAQHEAARLVGAIRDERRKLAAAGETVTFTSRRGSVPVTVTNAADYRVRVRVTVSSPKLDFPDGSSRVVTIDPPGEPITPFAAITRSTGTFPMLVTLTSPDRSVFFDRTELSVRSTAVNFSAIVLTAGGAVFLFGWFARRRARRRSSAS
jgi:hypothetical protein